MEHNSNMRTTKMKYNSKDINNNKYEVQFKTLERQKWNTTQKILTTTNTKTIQNIRTTKMKYNSKDNNNKYEIQFKT